MYRKPLCLILFVLVLGLAGGAAQAELAASLETADSGSSRSVDLTAEGTADWAYWWFDSVLKANEKAGATDIGEPTLIGNVGVGNDWKTHFDVTFTDGENPVSGTVDDVGNRVWIDQSSSPPFTVDEGYELVVAAGTVTRTLKLYIQNKWAYAKIVTTLGNESVETVVDSGDGVQTDYAYTLEFSHSSATELHVKYFCSPDAPYHDSIRLGAATLSGPLVQILTKAIEPIPADGQEDVLRDVVFGWTPGAYAAPTNGHKVFFSDNFNDVNDGIGGITQSASSYAPGRLDFNTTYYWRVDEIDGPPDYGVNEGWVWSFTTEPIAYPVGGANIIATASSTGQADFGPENTVNGSGLDGSGLHSTEATDMWLSGVEPGAGWIQYEFDKVHKLHEMWVWNSNQTFESLFGFGLRDVTVEYSTDGVDWTALANVPEFARAPGAAGYAYDTTVDFGSAVAQYVRLTATSNWGGVLPQYSLSEVRFFSIPLSAREPSPDSGAADVAVDGTLGWRVGREAATHDVYLGTDEQAVIDGNTPAVSVTDASYSPPLDLGQTYYWRIDEVNEAETPTTWQGDVWDFTTQQFIVVEDFEDYNDYPPHEIYTTWLDGYENPANGSQVGNLTPPLAETTIVHGGDQSMPLLYSNTGGATYSEGERTFDAPQDWTKHGVRTLGLYFFGTLGNTGQLYVKINGAKIPYDGQADNLARTGWQPWNIDLTASGLNLQSVSSLAIGIDGNGASGTLYFDDIRLIR